MKFYKYLKAAFLTTTLSLSLAAHAELVTFLKFDDNSNLLADSSGNNTVSTNFGALYSSFGYEGGALSLNGSNYVRVSQNVGITTMPKMTWGAWVNLTNNNPIKQVLSNDNGGYDRSIGIDSRGGTNGQYSSFYGSGVLGNGGAAKLNQWTFLAAVYDNTTGSLSYWVDANKVTTTTYFGNSAWSFFDIGHNPSFGEFLIGKVDNVFVYNEALTDAQINNIYLGGASVISGVPEPEMTGMYLSGLMLIGFFATSRKRI